MKLTIILFILTFALYGCVTASANPNHFKLVNSRSVGE